MTAPGLDSAELLALADVIDALERIEGGVIVTAEVRLDTGGRARLSHLIDGDALYVAEILDHAVAPVGEAEAAAPRADLPPGARCCTHQCDDDGHLTDGDTWLKPGDVTQAPLGEDAWRKLAHDRGFAHSLLLVRARELAEANGLPKPKNLAAVDEVLTPLLAEWLDHNYPARTTDEAATR